jgi:DNA invertase Pin-like site-specific DNA recombinase
MKRAVLYLRVSTLDQTTANQERELREIADRMGCEIVKVYKDHGISGTRGRDKRPGFDALCRADTKRQFDVIMAWSVDRLGRSLQDLILARSDCCRGYRWLSLLLAKPMVATAGTRRKTAMISMMIADAFRGISVQGRKRERLRHNRPNLDGSAPIGARRLAVRGELF